MSNVNYLGNSVTINATITDTTGALVDPTTSLLRTVLDVRLRATKGSTAIARRLVHVGLERRPVVGDPRGHRDARRPVEQIAHIAAALVAISLKQSRSPLTLRLLVGAGVTLLELEDACTDFPPLCSHRDVTEAELVDPVVRPSTAWGYRRLPHGRQLLARIDDADADAADS